MTLNEIIAYAQKHNLDFDKPVTAILEMNENIPLDVATCHGSVNKNVVLHAAPIEVFQSWRVTPPFDEVVWKLKK